MSKLTKRKAGWFSTAAALIVMASAGVALAEPTTITVRVLSHGAKFIGTSMGGMRITLRDVETGEVLARGVTSGGTGDTKRIMAGTYADTVSDDSAAGFTATLDLDRPRLIEAEAFGPLAQAQAAHRTASSMWVVPGRNVTAKDGWMLVLRGLVVDVLGPPAHIKLGPETRAVTLDANVAMMCGCPIEPKGLWAAEDFEVMATILRNGKPAGTVPLAYAGKTSQFTGTMTIAEPGVYEAIVSAYQASTGNTGLDRTTFIIEGKAK